MRRKRGARLRLASASGALSIGASAPVQHRRLGSHRDLVGVSGTRLMERMLRGAMLWTLM